MTRASTLAAALVFLATAEIVSGQVVQRVVVTVAAPVFVKPDARLTPLRVAREGSVLKRARE